jgi:hypothetical protein
MNMVDLGYALATILIAMIVVVRGYPLIQRLRAEKKIRVGHAEGVTTQRSSV